MSELEPRTMGKVTWRLVPFLMFCYFVAYLDLIESISDSLVRR
jgi:hypothetical protein